MQHALLVTDVLNKLSVLSSRVGWDYWCPKKFIITNKCCVSPQKSEGLLYAATKV